jgi:hypothetical protein
LSWGVEVCGEAGGDLSGGLLRGELEEVMEETSGVGQRGGGEGVAVGGADGGPSVDVEAEVGVFLVGVEDFLGGEGVLIKQDHGLAMESRSSSMAW